MSAATQLPLWAVYAVGIGTPVVSFVGVLIGQWITRRGAKELEKRSKREEVMRNMRWAAELAVSPEPRTSQLGVSQLKALFESPLLEEDELGFVDAALASVIEEAAEKIEDIKEAGDQAEVIQLPSVTSSETEDLASNDESNVLSGQQTDDDGIDDGD